MAASSSNMTDPPTTTDFVEQANAECFGTHGTSTEDVTAIELLSNALFAGISALPSWYDQPPAGYWDVCKARGEVYLEAMHGSDAEAGKMFNPARVTAASQFTDIADLAKWSWHNVYGGICKSAFDDYIGSQDILSFLGVSADTATAIEAPFVVDGSDVHIVSISHCHGQDDNQDRPPYYTVAGRNYCTTGAYYVFGMSPRGVIVTFDRTSPKHAAKNRIPKVCEDELPELQAFSDLAWLKWVETFDAEPTTMRYFLAKSVVNSISLSVFYEVLNEAGPEFNPEWPGFDVASNTESGAALLGTPNALAFSYFLVQHKACLGNLRIHKITLFQDRNGCDGFANMLFHVEPVPREDGLA
ncbi:hypothetical protein NX059_011039 [Plenodomus lindquistii]|nr:hypothetical protein NX059_011039 [Plenodomus lindquistii]